MSSLDTLESSLQDSRPLEVYRFSIGTSSWFYTSASAPVVLDGDAYEPESIARETIEHGSDSRSRGVTVTLPTANSFAGQYVQVVPGQKATLTIVRLQRDEVPTFNTRAMIYKGFVHSVRFSGDGHHAEVATRSLAAAGDQNMPRYSFMGQCNHVLYGPGCGADPAGHDHVGTVMAVNGNTITLSGASASGIAFRGGYCKPTGVSDFRMILDQAGDVLTLLLPFNGDVLGLSVQAFAGCDHLIAGDCDTVFNRVIENGGFNWVPNKNIFATGLDV